jgi:ketosteroid isomerase-like protein
MIFMRKTLMWSLGPCLLVMACVYGRAQDGSEAANIRALENKLMDAYKQRQVEVFAALLDDDFVATFEDGSIYGKTGYLSYAASPSLRVEVSEMSETKVRLHGNTAIITGAYHERGDFKGEPFDDHDRFTDIWMKEEGKWRLVASHYGIPIKR